MSNLVANETLWKARFFLSQARDTPRSDHRSFAARLEAAIIFGRSVTFHLQKQLSTHQNFPGWYENQQRVLGSAPVCKFLLNTRNYVLKEGPLQSKRVLSVHVVEAVFVTDSATVTIIRAEPWYRRPPRILIQDAVMPIRDWMRRRRDHKEALRAARERAERQRLAIEPPRDEIYFSDPDWSKTPAVDVVADYLQILEGVCAAAQREFRGAV